MKRFINLLTITALIFSCKSCSNSNKQEIPYSVLKKENFEKTVDGKQTNLYFIENGDIRMAVTNYGGRIVSLCTPDKRGEYTDIVFGFISIDEYLKANEVFHGAIIGRVANRIANGKFVLDGKEYTLPINNKTNHLHGGEKGFHNQVWDIEFINDTSISLSYFSKDGEMGYPGNLDVNITYILTPDNSLQIKYQANSDRKTPVMLTNHAFWNLSGEAGGSINDHILTINADSFIIIDSTLIPTGELAPVEGSVFDFRTPKTVGKDLSFQNENEQLKNGLGYDHNWPLNKEFGVLSFAGSILDPKSGIKMEVYTEEPVLLFYGGNFLNGKDIGKYGKSLKYREAFCLETQHFPDSPNQNKFPSIISNPGDIYQTESIYRFSVE
jgi:aldose 1-epimerase